ncbi:MAG: SNF2 helicase-associated domain-containing protein, partial [Acetobacteraceae bacterium]|nr:SNF2 helicase-associated domain-containing protein [Acetobacteraceae bacterium]
MSYLGLRLTPHGHLVAERAEDVPLMDETVMARLLDAFTRGSGYGLLRLGAGEVGKALPPVFAWWREFAGRFVTAVCLQSSDEGISLSSVPRLVAPPSEADLASLVLMAPMMPGSEYLSADILRSLWVELEKAFASSLAAAKTSLKNFLKDFHPAWNLVGRVHFNLAENRRDPQCPFAFMATYTTQLSAQAKARHLPLGHALREYAANKDKLLSLLVPVQRAAEACAWLKPLIDTGEIFHPLRWTPQEASDFLASVPDLEGAGVVIRMRASWRANRPPRPQVTATIGSRPPSSVGLDGLLDFRMEMTLEGEQLTEAEISTLLTGTDGLVLLRGQWVEVNRERLERAISQFRRAEELALHNRLTFAEASRMLAGAAVVEEEADVATPEWSRVSAGPWLAETLSALRVPNGANVSLGPAL